MKFQGLGLLVAAGVTVALLTGCSPAVAPIQASTPATSAATECGSCDGQPQAEHSGPSSLTLDQASEDAAVDAAVKVMGAYTDTGKPKEDWFTSLAPLITTGFAQDAQYIQPPRLTARTVRSAGSVLPSAVPDGHQVRVVFTTNAGDWVVVMTRTSGSAPWLASNVLPAEDAQ